MFVYKNRAGSGVMDPAVLLCWHKKRSIDSAGVQRYQYSLKGHSNKIVVQESTASLHEIKYVKPPEAEGTDSTQQIQRSFLTDFPSCGKKGASKISANTLPKIGLERKRAGKDIGRVSLLSLPEKEAPSAACSHEIMHYGLKSAIGSLKDAQIYFRF